MPEFLTIHEIASRLRVPISWVYSRTRRRTENTIPYIRVGKYLRFEEAEVLEWLRKQNGAEAREKHTQGQ